MKAAFFTFILILITLAMLFVRSSIQKPFSYLQTAAPRINVSPALSLFTRVSSGSVPSIPLRLPPGFTIHIFAGNLGNARDLVFTPGGTLLVSNPINNTVVALPDKNHDGVADENKIVVNKGTRIHGLAFYKGNLFVAEVNRVVRYKWREENLQATLDKVLFSLPNNSDHNNRTLAFDQHGNMYVSVGSTCNACYERSSFSGTVIASDANGNNPRVFATGLRNAAFITVDPKTGALWGTEMGRDYLGDHTPPDEINLIQSGKNYGWPLCYGNRIHDTQFDKSPVNSCQNTQPPAYNIPAHSAPLGLTFITSSQFSSNWQNNLLVAYHGSWNSSTLIGYKVVRMTVRENTITQVDDFLTGFIQNGKILGRPVDVLFDSQGNLYLSDDKSGNVYIVQKEL